MTPPERLALIFEILASVVFGGAMVTGVAAVVHLTQIARITGIITLIGLGVLAWIVLGEDPS